MRIKLICRFRVSWRLVTAQNYVTASLRWDGCSSPTCGALEAWVSHFCILPLWPVLMVGGAQPNARGPWMDAQTDACTSRSTEVCRPVGSLPANSAGETWPAATCWGCPQNPRPLPLPSLLTRKPHQERWGGKVITSKSSGFSARGPRRGEQVESVHENEVSRCAVVSFPSPGS